MVILTSKTIQLYKNNIMKILLVDSNYPINTRNTKILNSLKEKNPDAEIIVCTWNREQLNIKENKTYDRICVYNQRSKLGNKILKLFYIYGYYRFLRTINKEIRPDILIASHFDMLFLVSLIKDKNQILVYENLDIPTSNKKKVLDVLQWIERLALRKTDMISFASRFYLPLYDSFEGAKVQLENHPTVTNNYILQNHSLKQNAINISFIGGVRYVEILKNLILASADYSNIMIRIHGYGHQYSILDEFIKKGNYQGKVILTGRYNYEDIPQLYNDSDLIWAVYPNDNYNVKYAISNKFHETILFSKPGIYSNGTKLGDLVKEEEIGLTVNSGKIADIKNMLSLISSHKMDLNKLRNNIERYKTSAKTWDDEFSTFNEVLVRVFREKNDYNRF